MAKWGLWAWLVTAFWATSASAEAASDGNAATMPQSTFFFAVGPGLSLGVVHPAAVDDFIQRDLEASGFDQPMGAMVTVFVPRLVADLAITRFAAFEVVGELGWAPKIARYEDGEYRSYHFLRWSFGVLASSFVPIQPLLYAFLGAGALYHVLKFEGFEASDLGPRVQAGLRWYGRRILPEVVVAYDVVKGRDTRDDGMFVRELSLDATTLSIGLNLRFSLEPGHSRRYFFQVCP